MGGDGLEPPTPCL